MKIHLDKIASCTINAKLDREVEISDDVRPELGNVLVVRALREKTVYDKVELVSGRMAKISKGDVIAGVLGRRRALQGFVGEIPDSLRVGDRIHILNIGGVLGVVVSGNLDLGSPLLCEVVGAAMQGGEPASISRDVPPIPEKLPDVPLILVEGSCMNAGKTHAASTIIQQLTQRGYRLNAAKLTGVACLRDLLNMEDHGARRTRSFLDIGMPSTVGVPDVAGVARAMLADLASDNPDAIVVELGDGIIGHYGCDKILADPEILSKTKAHVMCANDLVAAWGASELMKSWGIDIDVMAGPATDNEVGEAYCLRELRVPAANARTNAHKLTDIVEARLVMPTSGRYRIGIAGASGYGGAETLRWLANHPGFEVCGVTSRQNVGKSVSAVHPHLAGFYDDLEFVAGPQELLESEPDAVVMGLPHRYAAAYANAMHAIFPELRIVDLSGDHRLDDAGLYRAHYHADHPHPEQLTSGDWKYGLVEANREALECAKLVANPGCFATGALLGALPLARRGLVAGAIKHVAITGSSGSGIEAKTGTHHPERVEDVKAYKILAHQHIPEVLLCLSRVGLDRATPWWMVPQSGPFARGIFTTLFVDVPAGTSEKQVRDAFAEEYADAPFVRLRDGTPRVSHVRATNFCDIAVTVGEGMAVVLTAIDNLGKGMASQAVQNLNLMFGYEETTGLLVPGSRP